MNSNNLDHLAIIMDGNGRWALERGLDRTAGHAAGEHSLSKTIDWAIKNNIQCDEHMSTGLNNVQIAKYLINCLKKITN